MAFTGTDYLVVWEEKQIGNDDLHAARVALDGSVLDRSGFPIATSPQHERLPRLTTGLRPNSALVVYTRYDPTLGTAAFQAHLMARYLHPS